MFLLYLILAMICVFIGLDDIDDDLQLPIWSKISATFFVLLCVANIAISVCCCTALEQDDYANIVSINNTTEVHSRGGLYHSIVNEKDVYKFYYSTKNGGYKMLTVPANGTTIIETNKEVPHYERYKRVTGRGKVFDFFFTTSFKSPDSYVRYIYVPKGTVVKEYSLDLER